VRNAEFVLPLEDELGRPGKNAPPIRRTLFGTSGRAQAWDGALHQIAHRPVAGYGFGTGNWVRIARSHMRSDTIRRCAIASDADGVTV